MLDLFDLFSHSGKKKTYTIKYPNEFFSNSGIDYKVIASSDITLNFESIKEGEIVLNGDFNVTLEMFCDRCLKPVEVKLEVLLSKDLLSEENRNDEDDNDEFWMLNGTIFDIVAYINQEILMNLPSKVLCKDDCLGICPVCGANNNETKCSCDTFVPDPRMAGIMDIFKGNKEV